MTAADHRGRFGAVPLPLQDSDTVAFRFLLLGGRGGRVPGRRPFRACDYEVQIMEMNDRLGVLIP